MAVRVTMSVRDGESGFETLKNAPERSNDDILHPIYEDIKDILVMMKFNGMHDVICSINRLLLLLLLLLLLCSH